MLFEYGINSKLEAYMLGFLYGDGCIQANSRYPNSKILTCALAEKDYAFLNNFLGILNKTLNKSYNLKYSKKTKSYKFYVCNSKFCSILEKLGIHQRKSTECTDEVFVSLPDCYKKYFILGLWDADGTFCKSHDARCRQIAGLISYNIDLASAIQLYINSQLGNICKLRIEKLKYARLTILDNGAKIFGDWLYFNVENIPYLQRKYEVYKSFIIGTKAHYGFNNKKTKGIYCIDTKTYYITCTQAAISEFGDPKYKTAIAANANGTSKMCKQKHFRYLTKEELEKLKYEQSII